MENRVKAMIVAMATALALSVGAFALVVDRPQPARSDADAVHVEPDVEVTAARADDPSSGGSVSSRSHAGEVPAASTEAASGSTMRAIAPQLYPPPTTPRVWG